MPKLDQGNDAIKYGVGVAGAALVLALGGWLRAMPVRRRRTLPEARRSGAAGGPHGGLRNENIYTGAMKILVKWLLSASALLLVAYLCSGVQVESFGPP